jgi:DNA-binding transcriptional LysR family regulator
VESGLGVALVPATSAGYAGEGVRLIPLTGLPEKLNFGLALATRGDTSVATTRNFVALARAVTQPPAP